MFAILHNTSFIGSPETGQAFIYTSYYQASKELLKLRDTNKAMTLAQLENLRVVEVDIIIK